MEYPIIYLGLATLAGIMMAVQGVINSALGDKLGPGETNFIVHTTAAIILLIFLLALQFIFGHNKLALDRIREVPWYLYLGGFIGVIITYGVIVSISRVGAAAATTAIVTGQVLTAAMADHLGILGLDEIPFSWSKLAGIILLGIAARLILK